MEFSGWAAARHSGGCLDPWSQVILVVGISFSPTNSHFICLEGCDMPATERGLWVEVSTVRAAGPAGAGRWPHFYMWSAFWFCNVSVCAAVCSQGTFCHTGVLLAPSRERPGCSLPFRTPDANLQAPDSIHGDASTCLLQGSHHPTPLRPLGKS